jgi:hypothetical protein
MPLPDKLLGPCFLGAKNKEGDLLFPVIICYMFGLRDLIWKLVHCLMSQLGCVIQVLGSFGLSWDFLSSKKKPKHCHHCQAKKKVQKWRRRALPYGLVMKCLH